MSNVMEFDDTVVTKLKEGAHHRNDVFVCLYNNMYGRVVGERFIRQGAGNIGHKPGFETVR